MNNQNIDTILMEALCVDFQNRGQKAIADACYDRQFCRGIGVDYTAIDVYTQIKEKLRRYQHAN